MAKDTSQQGWPAQSGHGFTGQQQKLLELANVSIEMRTRINPPFPMSVKSCHCYLSKPVHRYNHNNKNSDEKNENILNVFVKH